MMRPPRITPIALKILEGSLALIEQGWTQSTCARDKDGHSVYAQSPDAVRWCIIGAQTKTRGTLVADGVAECGAILMEVDTAHNWLRRGMPDTLGLSDYNDNPHRTKGEVVTLFKNAIADARKELSL